MCHKHKLHINNNGIERKLIWPEVKYCDRNALFLVNRKNCFAFVNCDSAGWLVRVWQQLEMHWSSSITIATSEHHSNLHGGIRWKLHWRGSVIKVHVVGICEIMRRITSLRLSLHNKLTRYLFECFQKNSKYASGAGSNFVHDKRFSLYIDKYHRNFCLIVCSFRCYSWFHSFPLIPLLSTPHSKQ